MKKSNTVSLIALFAVLLALGIYYVTTTRGNENELIAENPGYAEQFHQMKQNENGEVPRNQWKQWRDNSQSLRKAEFFSSIKELGPSNIGGRARTMLVDRSNTSRLIAGGVSGGIWISESAGATWTPLDDDASTLSITGITQSPFDHKIMYYCTGEVSSGAHINYDGNGVFKSTDGGNSFSQLEATDIPAFDKTWDIEHSLTDSNTIYVATIAFGLYRSTDAGETFEQIFKSGTDINDVDAMPDGAVYFTKESSGLYRFQEADTLVIEHLPGNGLPTFGFARTMVAPSPSDPSTIYCAMGGSDRQSLLGVFKSTDTAKTWKELNNRSTTSYNQIWHNFLLGIHPTNPNIVVMGGVTAEYTLNGGTSWGRLLNTHSDYHNLQFVPNTNDFYTVSDGGIYRYNTGSASSTAVNGNGNFNITQLYCGDFFPTGEKVIAGAQDNWTTVNNSGTSVFSQWLGGDGAFNAVDGTGDIIYASSQNGNIRRTNGSSWVNIYNSLASKVGNSDFWFINPFDIHPDDGENIFFPTKNRVARSTNSGSSWTVITNSIPGNIFSVGITREADPTVYFGGQSSLFYRVDNANSASPGNEVKLFTLGPPESRGGFIGNIEIDPNDNSTVYLAMSNASTLPRIWKVVEANTGSPQWVNISSNLPEGLPVNWIEVDPKNSDHIMAATDYGLYVTTNGGKWWEKETRIPNVYISVIKLRETDRKLFLFTFGRGVWIADLEDNIVNSVAKSENLKLSVYPNPVSNALHFPEVKSGQVQVVALNGAIVHAAEIKNGVTDVTAIANGTYIVQTTDKAGNKRTAKVLIQH